MSKIRKDQIGYYTSPYPDAKPDYEPPYPTECPYCNGMIGDDTVRTLNISMLYNRHTDKEMSCFYRVHRACDNAATDEQKSDLDDQVFKLMEQA